jgi:hypothetical protein
LTNGSEKKPVIVIASFTLRASSILQTPHGAVHLMIADGRLAFRAPPQQKNFV